MEFEGKVVIITGSTSGIGEQIAIDYAKNGAKVVIHGRNEARMNSVIEKCTQVSPKKLKPLGVFADLRTDDGLKKIIETTVASLGQIDVLVNNAGAASVTPVDDPRLIAAFDELIRTNLRPVVVLSSLSIPYLIKTKGCIVNISSCCAVKPFVPFLTIGAADAAKDMVTRSMALELGPKGVRVNSVRPGYIKTPAQAEHGFVFEDMPELKRQALTKHGRPSDISNCVLFLASSKSAFITGTILQCDAAICDG